MSNMSKIDVHHHVYPPAFTEALERAGGDPSGWYIPSWTVKSDQQISAQIGNRTAILSVTAPGPCIEKDPAKAAILARECNRYSAALRDQNRRGYGFFASLPSLLDTDMALEEMTYALDFLRADGITLFTRYGDDNHYLGHEDFRPIWAELNRRKAVVFVHPTHPVDTHLVDASLTQPIFDYPHETGRAAMDMIVGNTIKNYSNCKVILSHAGGTLPYLIYRSAGMLPFTAMSIGKSTKEIVQEAQTFYFDVAISSNPVTLKALFEFAKPEHVLFGSDFPNAPSEAIECFTQRLEDHEMSPDVKKDVYYGSALKLLPRLKLYYKKAGSKRRVDRSLYEVLSRM